jgi:opacity protein-like surface antigen
MGDFFYATPAVYRDYVNSDGSEIQQDFKLRVVPVTGIIRFIPTGRRSAIQPYVGAGIGILAWRYSETGQFIDTDANIFRATFKDTGVNAGPVVVGGVRFPVTTAFSFGGEIRYQQAEGSLPSSDFNGTKIDLGGITYQAQFVFHF